MNRAQISLEACIVRKKDMGIQESNSMYNPWIDIR